MNFVKSLYLLIQPYSTVKIYSMKSVKTIRVRVKDKHAKALRLLANEVNFVWNYCNELSLNECSRIPLLEAEGLRGGSSERL